jgi:hypothetical protein
MKYELIKTDISTERTVMQDIVEIIDDIETITGTEPTDSYEVTITLGIHPTDGIAPDFSKDIVVRSYNHMTGFQVDEQREQSIADYMQTINAVI